MNKRIKKKRAILLCVEGLITVNNKLIDKVEHQQKQIDELKQINSRNAQATNVRFDKIEKEVANKVSFGFNAAPYHYNCRTTIIPLEPVNVDYSVPSMPVLKIHTLEGVMTAVEGDFIIKGVQGEFYPCKPDIFEKTYERVV